MRSKLFHATGIVACSVVALFIAFLLEIRFDRSSPFIAFAASYVPSILMAEGGVNVCTESGSSNTFTLTCGTGSKAIQSYQSGVTYCFLATHGNTGASTGNVNTLGSKSITKLSGNNTALASGDIANGGSVCVMYDGTNLEMVSQLGNGNSGSVTTTGSPANGQMAKFSGASSITTATANDIENSLIATTTGSANAYVLALSPAATSLTNLCADFISNFSNTGAATININSLGAKNITKNGITANALASGDIGNGQTVRICYDGTQFEMQSQLGNASSGTVTNVTGTAPINVANGTSTPALTWTGLNNTGDCYTFGIGMCGNDIYAGNGNSLTTVNGTGGNNGANTVEYRYVWYPGGTVNNIIFEVVVAATSGQHWSWGLYNGSGNAILYTGQLCVSGTNSTPPLTIGVQQETAANAKDCGGIASTQIGLGTNIAAGFYWEFTTADATTLTLRSLVTTTTYLGGIFVKQQNNAAKLASGSTNGVPTLTGITVPPVQADTQGMPLVMVSK